jgi:NAD(P)-dependent dehydrogenase (short-subunit alcohol dehydrogenase family)
VFQLDVTDESSVATAVAAVVSRFGGIDVLVNNAGYGIFGPLEGASIEQIELQSRQVHRPVTQSSQFGNDAARRPWRFPLNNPLVRRRILL